MSDKNKANGSTKALNCIDLFAGAGGFSLAAKNVGLKIRVAVEMKHHAATTYENNLIGDGNETALFEKDILDIDLEDLAIKHFSKGDECDVVLGGPPCQGFSVHRINGAGVGDPRNKLILRYFKFVERLRPKVFLMENVPGILWKRHKDFIDEFYAAGTAAGYHVCEPVVVDARDYGVPQRRKRVFILGVRDDVSLDITWPPVPTHIDPKAENKLGRKDWLTSAEVFKKQIEKKDKGNVHMNHSPQLIEVFKSTPINGGSRKDSNRKLPCHKNHDGHKDVYGRIDPNVPGPTMTTACINPSKGRFVHPTEHHGITVRHAARFQTFPDWFVFEGGLIAAGEQIGNAVPVKLGESLLKAIADGLIGPSKAAEQ